MQNFGGAPAGGPPRAPRLSGGHLGYPGPHGPGGHGMPNGAPPQQFAFNMQAAAAVAAAMQLSKSPNMMGPGPMHGFPGMPGMGPGGMPGFPGPGGMHGMGPGGGPPYSGQGMSPGGKPPAGAPSPPVVTQRKSSAIRIVNPNTKEEVKGDIEKVKADKAAKEAAEKKAAEEADEARKEAGEKDAAAATSTPAANKPGTPVTPPAPPATPATPMTGAARPGMPGMPGGMYYGGPPPSFSPYGTPGYGMPPRPMMGSPAGSMPIPGTSPGAEGSPMWNNFSVGSPDSDSARAVAVAAHAHAHAHAQALAAAMAAAGMTTPEGGVPKVPQGSTPARPTPLPNTPGSAAPRVPGSTPQQGGAPRSAPKPIPPPATVSAAAAVPVPVPVPVPKAPHSEPTPKKAPEPAAGGLEQAMKNLSVEEAPKAAPQAPTAPPVAPPAAPPAAPATAPAGEKTTAPAIEKTAAPSPVPPAPALAPAPAPAAETAATPADVEMKEAAEPEAEEPEAAAEKPKWTPPTEGKPPAGTVPGKGEMKYTVAFLKAFMSNPACNAPHPDLKPPDDVDYWPLVGFVCPPGMGGGRGGGRSGRGGNAQWQGPGGGGRGSPHGGPGGPRGNGRGGGGGRGGDDRWGHTGLPPEQGGGNRGGRRGGGFGNYGQPVSNRHDPRLPQLQQIDADKKFKVGGMDKSAMDEEERKQRSFKSILNKLTPQNFEKLLEKVLEEGISAAETLIGLIAQLFDKALTEPTFAELYATMCQQLSDRFLSEGVEFLDPEGNPEDPEPKKITFKRVLLNKCQEEFEKGDGAIKAAEQEQKDAAAAKERGETTEDKEEEAEEGEIKKPKTKEELELDERRKENARAERLMLARKRMLGNIKFIGELFKKQMLTERIMHTCIMKLLGETKNPDEEDVEALCKLLSTIGGQLDHPKAKAHMDAYLKRISDLSKNMTISSRHRFMCQDVIEMRNKGWRQRRKEEGPKKIEDVHRDAARDAMNAARGGGAPRRDDRGGRDGRERGGGGRDFNDRGPPNQRGGGGFGNDRDRGMDGRRGGGRDRDRDDRDRDGRGSREALPEGPPRAMRGGSTLGSDAGAMLGPRSGLGRGGPSSGAGGGPFGRSAGGRGGEGIPAPRGNGSAAPGGATTAGAAAAKAPAASSKAEAPAPMSDEEYETEREKLMSYFFDDKDVGEAVKTMKGWGGFDARVPQFVETFVTTGFERRQMDWEAAAKLFRAMPNGAGGACDPDALLAGVRLVVDNLEDWLCDLPKADQHLAALVAGPIADGHVSFADFAGVCKLAGPEDEEGYVLREGFALPLLCKTLHAVAVVAGAPRAAVVFENSDVVLSDFLGELDAEEEGAAEGIVAKHKLADILYPLVDTKAKLAEALGENAKGAVDAGAISAWLEENVAATTRKTPEFVAEVAAATLSRGVPSPAEATTSAPLAALEALMPLLRAATTGPPDEAASRPEREMGMLFAAQKFVHAAGHPKGLLTRLFRDLYNGDVVDEPAMQSWRDDTTDRVPGKTQALYDVTEYLVELEAEAEDEDDDYVEA